MSAHYDEDKLASLDEYARTTTQGQEMVPLGPVEITHAAPPDLMEGPKNIKPRNVGEVLKNIRSLAAAAGNDWYYRIPFKDNKTGKTSWVEGPSKSLANAVLGEYGNARVHPWCSAEGLDYWEITAVFVDYQSGVVMARPFRQRKDAGKIGGGDNLRKMEIAYAIGVSKATRNVIVNALETYTSFAFEQARSSLVDKIGKDLEHWRDVTAERIANLVDIKRVEAVVGRSMKDWLAPDIAKIVAMGKSIQDGMATVNETFPELKAEVHADTKAQLDELSQGKVETNPSGQPDLAAPDDHVPHEKPDAAMPDPVDPIALSSEAIDKFLNLACNQEISWEERQKALKKAQAMWTPKLTAELTDRLFAVSMQVVNGELTPEEAEDLLKAS